MEHLVPQKNEPKGVFILSHVRPFLPLASLFLLGFIFQLIRFNFFHLVLHLLSKRKYATFWSFEPEPS